MQQGRQYNYSRLRDIFFENEENDELEPLVRTSALREEMCDLCGHNFIFFGYNIGDGDFVFMCDDCEENFVKKVRKLMKKMMRKQLKKISKRKVDLALQHVGLEWEDSVIAEDILNYMVV